MDERHQCLVAKSILVSNARYDLAKQQLLAPRHDRGKSMVEDAHDLKPDSNGRLEIRILLDHSTLEIFGEKNTFSCSLLYGFLPEDRRIGLRALGADVPVIELKCHRVTGIWK
jgi:sucrose-6-phosphate hydrolase SacC (GH32 family)